MSATKRRRIGIIFFFYFVKMLTITDYWGRFVRHMLTIADKGGKVGQGNGDNH